jgi:hypothetical protein
VLVERGEPETAKRRRLEALLGRDPDSVADDTIEALLADATLLGERALDEVAADAARGTPVLTAAVLEQLARDSGYGANARDAVTLTPDRLPKISADVPAWRIGAETAKALRSQESLDGQPISDDRLARLSGTQVATIEDRGIAGVPLSFALDAASGASRVVLRSKWATGRRFDLARLLGDRLISAGGALHPATRAHTYRQKAQRSFAAELLSPFEAVDEMLAGDYSLERQQDVAEHFDVSPMTIDTLLKNHGRIEREAFDADFEVATA